MDTVFQAFTFKGRKLLAVRQDNGIAILADNGDSYGTYISIESFKKFQDGDLDSMRLCTVRLALWNV